MVQQPTRFLVVTDHPHDFTWCAGTCGIHTSLGDTVTVISVTYGTGTHNERLLDELKKPKNEQDSAIINETEEEYGLRKAGELRSAAALFSVTDVRFLGLPQPFSLSKYPEAVDSLRSIILEVRPEVLLTQSPQLRGPHGLVWGTRDDHSETAYAVLEARSLAQTPRYGERDYPHTIAATYFLDSPCERPDQYDFVVDIGDWFKQRVQAEAIFESQGHTPDFARRRLEIELGSVGWHHRTRYAEPFVREKSELLSRITVPESALRLASEPHRLLLQRLSGDSGTDF